MDQSQPPRPRHIRDVQVKPTTTPKEPTATPRISKKLVPGNSRVRFFVAVVLVLLAALFVRNYMQTRNKLQDDPAQLSATIGKFLELPQGEIPTVASVKDAGKLKGQPFFDHAQNDDKVLIYTKSGKAVLYRPSTKRVVEFSRVNLGNATP